MALKAVPTPEVRFVDVDLGKEEKELADTVVALRRIRSSSLMPGHAQAAIDASASLLEMFAPRPVLAIADADEMVSD